MTGEYSCKAVLDELDFYGTGTANASVIVWEKPNIVMEPNVTTVQKYENISISCYVANINEAYHLANDSLEWCFADSSEILEGKLFCTEWSVRMKSKMGERHVLKDNGTIYNSEMVMLKIVANVFDLVSACIELCKICQTRSYNVLFIFLFYLSS